MGKNLQRGHSVTQPGPISGYPLGTCLPTLQGRPIGSLGTGSVSPSSCPILPSQAHGCSRSWAGADNCMSALSSELTEAVRVRLSAEGTGKKIRLALLVEPTSLPCPELESLKEARQLGASMRGPGAPESTGSPWGKAGRDGWDDSHEAVCSLTPKRWDRTKPLSRLSMSGASWWWRHLFRGTQSPFF